MIANEKDSIKYVVENQEGTLQTLSKKVSDEQINFLKNAGFIAFDEGDNYKTSNNAIEFYTREYGLLEEKNFLGF